MSKTRRRVQPEDIIKMNELYLEIGTYAGVGRATGWSGSTVKRYIDPNYQPQSELAAIEEEDFKILEQEGLKKPEDWNEFLRLTEEELEECKELQKTIIL